MRVYTCMCRTNNMHPAAVVRMCKEESRGWMEELVDRFWTRKYSICQTACCRSIILYVSSHSYICVLTQMVDA